MEQAGVVTPEARIGYAGDREAQIKEIDGRLEILAGLDGGEEVRL